MHTCRNSSFDNLTNCFTIHEMYDCQCIILKEMNIVFVTLSICSIVNNLISTSSWRNRNKYYRIQIQKLFSSKDTSTYWKFKNKSLNCFKHQINIVVVLLSCRYFYHYWSVCWVNKVLMKLLYFFAKGQHSVRSIF